VFFVGIFFLAGYPLPFSISALSLRVNTKCFIILFQHQVTENPNRW